MIKKLSDNEVSDLKTRFAVYQSIEKRENRVHRMEKLRFSVLALLFVLTVGYALVEYFIFQTDKFEMRDHKREGLIFINNCKAVHGMVEQSSKKLMEIGDGYSDIWMLSLMVESSVNDDLAKETSRLKENDEWSSLETNHRQMEKIITDMKSPPEGYDACFAQVHELYRLYCQLYNTVKNTSGDRQSYRDKLYTLSARLQEKSDKFEELYSGLAPLQAKADAADENRLKLWFNTYNPFN